MSSLQLSPCFLYLEAASHCHHIAAALVDIAPLLMGYEHRQSVMNLVTALVFY